MPATHRALPLLALVAAGALALSSCGDSASESVALPQHPSVIILSGDGMGSQQRTAIQYHTYGLDERQPMDALPVAGMLDTIPGDPEYAVSDSAAGATAWAVGKKVPNGTTGLGPNR